MGHYKHKPFAIRKDGSMFTYLTEEKYKQLIERIKPRFDVKPPEHDYYATGDNIFILDGIWYYLTKDENFDDESKSVCYFYAWDKKKGEQKLIDKWFACHPLMLSYNGKSGLYYFFDNKGKDILKKYDIETGEVTSIGPRPH